MEDTSPIEQMPSANPPVIHRSSNPFLIVLLVIAVLIIGLLGGYILWGNKTQQSLVSNTVQTQIATPTVSSMFPTPTPIVDVMVSSKTYTSKKIPGNSLDAFSIQYPSNWAIDTKSNDASETVTISRNNYEIKFFQAAMGGGGCIFEGDVPVGPFGDLRGVKYTQIEISAGTLRRFISTSQQDASHVIFGFCMSKNNKDYMDPTQFGVITYTVPKDYTEAMLFEMDSIIKSLKQLK